MKMQVNRNKWFDEVMNEIEADMEPYKNPVALVGMAETSRVLAPYHIERCEIWTLNEAPHVGGWLSRYDRLFQIHHDWDFLRGYHSEFRSNHNFAEYAEWLLSEPPYEDLGVDPETRREPTQSYVDRPAGRIIMQREFPNIAGAEKYPLEEILEECTPNDDQMKYFTSTFPYMVAQALREGKDWIGCFGWEMGSGSEYGAQRPSACLWLGYAMGKGVRIYVPPQSRLLGGGLKLYGFENEPRVGRMHIEIQHMGAAKMYKKAEEERNQLMGERTVLIRQIKGANPGTRRRMNKKLEVLGKKMIQNMAIVNSTLGAKSALKRQLLALDQLPTSDEMPVLMPKFGEISEEPGEDLVMTPLEDPLGKEVEEAIAVAKQPMRVQPVKKRRKRRKSKGKK